MAFSNTVFDALVIVVAERDRIIWISRRIKHFFEGFVESLLRVSLIHKPTKSKTRVLIESLMLVSSAIRFSESSQVHAAM